MHHSGCICKLDNKEMVLSYGNNQVSKENMNMWHLLVNKNKKGNKEASLLLLPSFQIRFTKRIIRNLSEVNKMSREHVDLIK